jgi:hypothetical protein
MQRKSRKGIGGRPQLPVAVKLSERVMCNLTRSERAQLRQLAGAEGVSEGSHMRRLLVRHLARRGR